jgi:malonyl-CoA decarboxylase
MVNYRYEPDKLQDRIDAYERDGLIEATSAVRRLAR